jgi:hypothetical protein
MMTARSITRGLLSGVLGALAFGVGCGLVPQPFPPSSGQDSNVSPGPPLETPAGHDGGAQSGGSGADGSAMGARDGAGSYNLDGSAGSDGYAGDSMEDAAADGPPDAQPGDDANIEASCEAGDACVPETAE